MFSLMFSYYYIHLATLKKCRLSYGCHSQRLFRMSANKLNVTITPFSKICRCCLREWVTAKPIFSKHGQNAYFPDILKYVTGEEVKEDDKFPTNICIDCSSAVESASIFKKKMISSTLLLKTLVKAREDVEILKKHDKIYKKNICDNIKKGVSDVGVEIKEKFEILNDKDETPEIEFIADVNRPLKFPKPMPENIKNRLENVPPISVPKNTTIYKAKLFKKGSGCINSKRLVLVPMKSLNLPQKFTPKSSSLDKIVVVPTTVEITSNDGAENIFTVKTLTNEQKAQLYNNVIKSDPASSNPTEEKISEELGKIITNQKESEAKDTTEVDDIPTEPSIWKNTLNRKPLKVYGHRSNSTKNIKPDEPYTTGFIPKFQSVEDVHIPNLPYRKVGHDKVVDNKLAFLTPKEVLFACNICAFTTYYRRIIQMHYRKRHYNEGTQKRQCDKCKREFQSLRNLISHKQRPGVQCKKCDDTTRYCNLKTLRRDHIEKCHSEEDLKIFKCPKCPRRYKKILQQVQHTQIHHGLPENKEQPVQKKSCSFCEKMFISDYELHKHEYLHKNLSHLCDICGEKLQTERALIEHVAKHNNKLKHACEYCVWSTDKKERLQAHIRSRHREYCYVCLICNIPFPYPHLLSQHQVLKHENPWRDCSYAPLCTRKTLRTDEGTFEAHNLEHVNPLPNQCPQCLKRHKDKDSLDVHKCIVVKFNRYFCLPCAKFIDTGKKYDAHNLSKHGLMSMTGAVKLNYDCKKKPCPQCGVMVNAMRMHSHNSKHHNPNRMSCKKCQVTFITEAERRDHLQKHDQAKPFKCTVCNKAFLYRLSWYYHDMVHRHPGRLQCRYCDTQFKQTIDLAIHERKHATLTVLSRLSIEPPANKPSAEESTLSVAAVVAESTVEKPNEIAEKPLIRLALANTLEMDSLITEEDLEKQDTGNVEYEEQVEITDNGVNIIVNRVDIANKQALNLEEMDIDEQVEYLDDDSDDNFESLTLKEYPTEIQEGQMEDVPIFESEGNLLQNDIFDKFQAQLQHNIPGIGDSFEDTEDMVETVELVND